MAKSATKPKRKQTNRKKPRRWGEIQERHKTQRIEVAGKMVSVDTLMVPVVWLFNQQCGVRTFSCCEGYDMPPEDKDQFFKEERYAEYNQAFYLLRPYIAFTCMCLDSLGGILDSVHTSDSDVPGSDGRSFADGEMNRFNDRTTFVLRFHTKDALRDYIKHLEQLSA